MLFLYPEVVRMDRARDFELDDDLFKKYMKGKLPSAPAGGSGIMGHPTAATVEKGESIYKRMLHIIGDNVFLAPKDVESDTI
jgi:creatinine amidohydrolase/Fe(II)-dependent formamide hydrolase-like protein